ncbi:MAG: protein kinase domain-containing protein [Bryobacteraceae bacterium]
MNAARWQQVKSILDQALQVPSDQREQFLANICAGDSALRYEVKELLGFSQRAVDLLPDDGAVKIISGEAERAHDLPARAGPYRIIREIGRGGMGVVCLAKRDDGEYERFVAVKLIRSGVEGDKFAKLFWRERQILAQLDHPNIARLLDGGTTETGQPYYAMELVDGEPVDKYCQQHALNLRERLQLFISICSAVSYAHRNLIIHRDLKPRNVLITHDGVPKLLDFGLARLVAEESQLEATTGMPLTPLYASPEQMRGEALTVASDIYSLGVLLYQMLSDRHPYGSSEGTAATLWAALEKPPIPLRHQNGDVPADLENVVMMALRKEPERRYATVDALCEDLTDFLDGFPVSAAPDTVAYRFSKFAKRNRWAVVVGSIALLAMIISGIIIWREKQQAEMRFQQVRQLAHSVVFELGDAIEDLPGSSRARELLIARGLGYLNALVKNRGQDSALSLELAKAYMKIGAAQGDLQQANVGDREGALASYNEARALLTDLHRRDPGDRDVERSLALVDNDIVVLSPRARVQQVQEIRQEAVALFKNLARTSAGVQGLKDRALAHFYLAFAETDYKKALPIWRQALDDYTRIQRLENNSSQTRRNVALIEKRIAGVYYGLGNYAESLAHDRRAAQIDEARLALQPRSPTARMDLSFDLVELGWCLHELGNNKEADDNLNRAIELRRQVAAADPHDFRAQSELETVLRIAGVIKSQAGSLSEAQSLMQEAAALGAALHTRDSGNMDETVNFALDCLELGNVQRTIALRGTAAGGRNWKAALNNFQRSQMLAASIPPDAFAAGDREKVAELPAKIAESLRHSIE